MYNEIEMLLARGVKKIKVNIVNTEENPVNYKNDGAIPPEPEEIEILSSVVFYDDPYYDEETTTQTDSTYSRVNKTRKTIKEYGG